MIFMIITLNIPDDPYDIDKAWADFMKKHKQMFLDLHVLDDFITFIDKVELFEKPFSKDQESRIHREFLFLVERAIEQKNIFDLALDMLYTLFQLIKTEIKPSREILLEIIWRLKNRIRNRPESENEETK